MNTTINNNTTKRNIAPSNRQASMPIPLQEVESRMIVVRQQQVLLDRDVAQLYGVETKRINEAVRNNLEKFPDGYIIELTKEESIVLRSKFSTLEPATGKGRYSKYNFKAFTEKGLTDLVMPDLQTSETESTLEINFFIGKLKHTVKRVRKESKEKQQGY